jgi:hypothetical protein
MALPGLLRRTPPFQRQKARDHPSFTGSVLLSVFSSGCYPYQTVPEKFE